MATRTNTELKVFLEGTLAQYNALTDKAGTVFFDSTNHALYVEGVCVMKSAVENVTYNDSTTELTITAFGGAKTVINLGIQRELDLLQDKLEDWVADNFTSNTIFETELDKKVDKVNGSRLMTDAEGTKLAGIQKEAQKNRNVVAIDTVVGDGDNNDTIVLTGNLVNKSKASNGEVGFSLSHRYDANDKRIYFFNSATAPTTGTTGHIFYIDTTDFVKDGMLANASYDNDTHTLTLVFNATATDSGVENIEVDLGKLVDVYKAGAGLRLTADDTFYVNYGYGLIIDPEHQELTVDIGDGLKFGTNSNKITVDWTKAPVQSVNGQTGAVNIDVTPKVWQF